MPLPLTASYFQSALKLLRFRWGITAVFGILSLVLGGQLAQTWWPAPYPLRWGLLTSVALAYFLGMFWRNLELNHRPGEEEILPTLGIGNILSLARGILMALFVGFLFSPRPGGEDAADWRTWIPGALYTLAALPDYLDGYFARRTNHVTKLGETLDMNIDSIGVLSATLLAFLYGIVPWWYLPIGLARYLFLGGIWIRQKLGKPVFDLPFSVRRRGFAALKMGFIFVVLLPIFKPPGTFIAAAAFGIPFAFGFVWDWLIVSGVLAPDSGDHFTAWKDGLLRKMPLVLRGLVLLLAIPQISQHLQQQENFPLVVLEILAVSLLISGVLARSAAILALILIGVSQAIAPLSPGQSILIIVFIALLFSGSGDFSLWPVEDRLVSQRVGDA